MLELIYNLTMYKLFKTAKLGISRSLIFKKITKWQCQMISAGGHLPYERA